MPKLNLKAFWKRAPRAAGAGDEVAPIAALGSPLAKPLFDPNNLQYDANRQRRRQKLVRYSGPAVVLVLLLALWLSLPMPLTQIAIINYGRNNFPAARNWLAPLSWTSPQPFIIAFNTGTVDTRLGRYTQAEAELTKALSLAPADKRCMVLQNLVIAYSQHATSVKNQGLTEKALTYNNQAAGIAKTNPKCFPANTSVQPAVTPTPQPGKGGGGGGGGGGADQTQAPDLLTPAQLLLLQQKNTQAQAIQQQDSTQTDQVDPNNLTVHPW